MYAVGPLLQHTSITLAYLLICTLNQQITFPLIQTIHRHTIRTFFQRTCCIGSAHLSVLIRSRHHSTELLSSPKSLHHNYLLLTVSACGMFSTSNFHFTENRSFDSIFERPVDSSDILSGSI